MWFRHLLHSAKHVVKGSSLPAAAVALGLSRGATTANFHYVLEGESAKMPPRPIDLPAEEHSLTHQFMLRQSCGSSLEGASTMLTRVVAAAQDSVGDYVKAMSLLIELYQSPDPTIALSSLNDQNVETVLNQRCARLRKVVQDLELLFRFVTKLMDSNAEVCFLVGAEFASTQASERLHSAKRAVEALFDKARLLELELAEAQRGHIERTETLLRENSEEESGESKVNSEETVAS